MDITKAPVFIQDQYATACRVPVGSLGEWQQVRTADLKPAPSYEDFVAANLQLDPKMTGDKYAMGVAVQDMCVFKKTQVAITGFSTYHDVIVNLIIPKGTRVLTQRHTRRKMRAAQAFVHSQFVVAKCGDHMKVHQISKSHSWWRNYFQYADGYMMKPNYFDQYLTPCAAGIHFFHDLEAALAYDWT